MSAEGGVVRPETGGANPWPNQSASGSAAPPSSASQAQPATSTSTLATAHEPPQPKRMPKAAARVLEEWLQNNDLDAIPTPSQANVLKDNVLRTSGYRIEVRNVQDWFRRRRTARRQAAERAQAPPAVHLQPTAGPSAPPSHPSMIRRPPKPTQAQPASVVGHAFAGMNIFSGKPSPSPQIDTFNGKSSLSLKSINALRSLRLLNPSPNDEDLRSWARSIHASKELVVEWLQKESSRTSKHSTPAPQPAPTITPTTPAPPPTQSASNAVPPLPHRRKDSVSVPVPPTPVSPTLYRWTPSPPPPSRTVAPSPSKREALTAAQRLPTPANTISSARSTSPPSWNVHPDQDSDDDDDDDDNMDVDADRDELDPDSPDVRRAIPLPSYQAPPSPRSPVLPRARLTMPAPISQSPAPPSPVKREFSVPPSHSPDDMDTGDMVDSPSAESHAVAPECQSMKMDDKRPDPVIKAFILGARDALHKNPTPISPTTRLSAEEFRAKFPRMAQLQALFGVAP